MFCGNAIGQWNKERIAKNPDQQNWQLHQQMFWLAAIHPDKRWDVGGGFHRDHEENHRNCREDKGFSDLVGVFIKCR